MRLSSLRFTILDRYLLAELAGPFVFGLAAFTMMISAAQIISIGRLISDAHAPAWAAIELFLWQLPYIETLVIPMALLLGTLLAVSRLSGDSEMTAMKAGGITLYRIAAPLLVAGFVVSLVNLVLQEAVVPFANDRIIEIQSTVVNRTSLFNRDLNVSAPLPGGGRQVTFATAYEPHTLALLHVTLIQYDARGTTTLVAFADRAEFLADQWTLDNVSTYRFNPDGTVTAQPQTPKLQVDLGESPTDLVKRVKNDNPEQMSRSEIADIVHSGQLNKGELRKYVTTYQEKLAQPFACFVFVLLALPFGIRNLRGGGSTSLGFGLAVAIIFVYYVVLTFFTYIGEALLPLAAIAAWMPNALFTVFGAIRLRRAATV